MTWERFTLLEALLPLDGLLSLETLLPLEFDFEVLLRLSFECTG